MWNLILQVIFTGLTIGSIYAMIGIGLALIHNTTGIVNFAHGQLAVISVLAAITLINVTQIPLWAALGLSILAGAALGIVFDLVIIRPVNRLPPFTISLVTLALASVLDGLIIMIWGKETFPFPTLSQTEVVRVWGAAIQTQSLWILGFVVLSVFWLYVYLNGSLTGKAMLATAENRYTSQLMGIDTRVMISLSFAVGAGIAALGGFLVAPITSVGVGHSVSFTIKGLIAAVLGGFERVTGPLIGGLILGMAEALAAGFISSLFKDVIAFGLLLVLMYYQRGGMLHESQRRV